MSILSSLLREPIQIEYPENEPDGYGGTTRSWQVLATVFARVESLESVVRERMLGDRPVASAGYRLTIRYRPEVNAAMRIRWKSHVLLIHSLHEHAETLTLLCYEEDV
jgi:SPP1 family predicted phage head-tail adaptor